MQRMAGMASLGHLAVGLAAGRLHAGASGPRAASTILFVLLATFPDADAMARRLGAGPGSPWLHRGALHSLLVAALAGVAAAALLGGMGRSRLRLALAAAAAAASHGLLDALTDGGSGVALLWPWSSERFFAAVRPIPVAPIGLGVASRWGLHVLGWEAVAFAPLLLYGSWPGGRAARAVTPR